MIGARWSGPDMLLTREVVLSSCTRDSDWDITALEESEMVSRGRGPPGDQGHPHLHDVGGSGDFESLSTDEDE